MTVSANEKNVQQKSAKDEMQTGAKGNLFSAASSFAKKAFNKVKDIVGDNDDPRRSKAGSMKNIVRGAVISLAVLGVVLTVLLLALPATVVLAQVIAVPTAVAASAVVGYVGREVMCQLHSRDIARETAEKAAADQSNANIKEVVVEHRQKQTVYSMDQNIITEVASEFKDTGTTQEKGATTRDNGAPQAPKSATYQGKDGAQR